LSTEGNQARNLPFVVGRNALLANAGGSGSAATAGEGDEENGDTAPAPNGGQVPGNQPGVQPPPSDLGEQIPPPRTVIPEFGTTGMLPQEDGDSQTEEFWASNRWEENSNSLETLSLLQEERQVQLAGAIAAVVLARVPEWMPREEELKKRSRRKESL